VGPELTTIAAIAERPGVQRSTLYRHFADEVVVFGACSSQWFEDHPWPAVSAWEMVANPVERLGTACGWRSISTRGSRWTRRAWRRRWQPS
jgi:AcrR family transcriptional regulator